MKNDEVMQNDEVIQNNEDIQNDEILHAEFRRTKYCITDRNDVYRHV